MAEDDIEASARALLTRGTGAFSGPDTDAFVEQVGQAHPVWELFTSATASAMAEQGLGDAAAGAAAAVYRNFVWTHFVSKLIMTALPLETIEYMQNRLDLSELTGLMEDTGPAIIAAFHYTGYPLVAMGLTLSPLAPLITKARVDAMERSGQKENSDHVVYLSDRSAAVTLTRRLREGRSAWVMLDVVLPGVRTVPARLLRGDMRVGAGLGKIAKLSGRPCIPVHWDFGGDAVTVRPGKPIEPGAGSEESIITEFVSTQARYIEQRPAEWLEWYSALGESPAIREKVKSGNEFLWSRLSRAIG